MKRVGVIGGGQLAWMMAEAAKKLDLDLIIQTPKLDDPAVSIATHAVVAPVADARATAELANRCDVITFENEFVDLDELATLAEQGVLFCPSLDALRPILDKFEQRHFLQQHHLPTPQFSKVVMTGDRPIPDVKVVIDDPNAAPEETQFGTLTLSTFPVVLKACRHGYDGQGTFIIHNQEELEAVLQHSSASDWLLEEFIPFERELAVIAVRSVRSSQSQSSEQDEIVVYPVVETQQENQVCRRVFVTNDFDRSVVEQMKFIAQEVLRGLDYVGVMGIECFLTRDGRVLVNELAPRTHNSGHYSLDACITSQFEQQLRSVTGLPLGNPSLTCAGAVMVNLLGYEAATSDYAEKREQLAALPNAHVYWYGKSESRPGRKLGHVTVTLEDGQERQHAETIAAMIESIWYGA